LWQWNCSGTEGLERGGTDPCLVVTTAEGLANSMGIRGSLAVSMVLMGVSLGKDSDRADDTGSMAIRVGMDRGCMDSDSLVDRAVLTGNLLVDWVADLSGNWVAFLHWGGNCDFDRD